MPYDPSYPYKIFERYFIHAREKRLHMQVNFISYKMRDGTQGLGFVLRTFSWMHKLAEQKVIRHRQQKIGIITLSSKSQEPTDAAAAR